MKNKTAAYAAIVFLFAVSAAQALHFGVDVAGGMWGQDQKDLAKSKDWMNEAEYFNNSNDYLNTRVKVTNGDMGVAAVFFMEGEAPFRLGLSAGYGMMPGASLSGGYTEYFYTDSSNWYRDAGDIDLESNPAYIPVDLYVKYKPANGRFSLFGGAGANYIMASADYKENYSYNAVWSGSPSSGSGRETGTFEQNKIVPHVQAGTEVFLTSWLSLSAGIKAVFGGVLDNLTGSVTEDGVPQGKCRLLMKRESGNFEMIDWEKTSQALTSSQRPFKYDFSGLRANAALRIYFK